MMNKEKKHFSLVICVGCITSCPDGVFQRSTGCTKKFYLSPTIVATFGKH